MEEGGEVADSGPEHVEAGAGLEQVVDERTPMKSVPSDQEGLSFVASDMQPALLPEPEVAHERAPEPAPMESELDSVPETASGMPSSSPASTVQAMIVDNAKRVGKRRDRTLTQDFQTSRQMLTGLMAIDDGTTPRTRIARVADLALQRVPTVPAVVQQLQKSVSDVVDMSPEVAAAVEHVAADADEEVAADVASPLRQAAAPGSQSTPVGWSPLKVCVLT